VSWLRCTRGCRSAYSAQVEASAAHMDTVGHKSPLGQCGKANRAPSDTLQCVPNLSYRQARGGDKLGLSQRAALTVGRASSERLSSSASSPSGGGSVQLASYDILEKEKGGGDSLQNQQATKPAALKLNVSGLCLI
jgi:hypothetical protein